MITLNFCSVQTRRNVLLYGGQRIYRFLFQQRALSCTISEVRSIHEMRSLSRDDQLPAIAPSVFTMRTGERSVTLLHAYVHSCTRITACAAARETAAAAGITRMPGDTVGSVARSVVRSPARSTVRSLARRTTRAVRT